MAELQYTGTVRGVEVAAKGPHKVLIEDPSNPSFNKTFRVWGTVRDDQGNDTPNPAYLYLASKNGQQVTVNYTEEQRPGGPQGTYKQNLIRSVAGQNGTPAPAQQAQAAPQPQAGLGWDEATERRRASLIAAEVVLQLRNAGGWPVPEGAAAQQPAQNQPPLTPDIYDGFLANATEADYNEQIVSRIHDKLYPSASFEGWRYANAEMLTAIANQLAFEWK